MELYKSKNNLFKYWQKPKQNEPFGGKFMGVFQLQENK